MNAEHRARKQAIRAFFIHYTDERLAMLLAHAQEGKLRHYSCCCFAGIANIQHGLTAGFCANSASDPEYLDGGYAASFSYCALANFPRFICEDTVADAKRRRILIPMIRAEQRLRERRSSLRRSPVREEVLNERACSH
jgi:hypothetical protein